MTDGRREAHGILGVTDCCGSEEESHGGRQAVHVHGVDW
jgi:hypothetical protein